MAAVSQSRTCAARPPLACPRGQRAACRAENDKKSVNFSGNKNSALGYTDDDSAGQSNIFAVEPRRYVTGSRQDETGRSVPTLAVGVVAGIVALGVAVLGLSGSKDISRTMIAQYEDAGKYQSLSYYANKLK